MFAFRKNNWVLVKGKGSGGFLEVPDTTHIKEPYQLYNLALDKGEQQNLYSKNEQKAAELMTDLKEVVNR